MGKFVDRTGEKYGRLIVLSRSGTSAHGAATWLCQCVCGNTKVVLSQSLTRGMTTSCGCAQREATAASNALRIKHGHARGHRPSPEWISWKNMTDRCYLPSAQNYPLYGGRGITICDQWRGKDGFAQFLKDMGERHNGYTLDRIDTDGNYEPGNVRWATAKEQSNNRRDTPEYAASRKASLDAGRKRMWEDPEIRARLVADRQRKGRIPKQPKAP